MAAGNSTFSTFATSTLRNYRKTLIENILGQQALWMLQMAHAVPWQPR